MALNSASFNAAPDRPAVAGALIAGVGTRGVFLINAASFAAVIVSLSLLRVDRLRIPIKLAADSTLKPATWNAPEPASPGALESVALGSWHGAGAKGRDRPEAANRPHPPWTRDALHH